MKRRRTEGKEAERVEADVGAEAGGGKEAGQNPVDRQVEK